MAIIRAFFFTVLAALLALCIPAAAQYGNEWIKSGQSYFKIPVATNGVYRITFNDLVSAGVPIASIDPRRINILHRGQEQAILVQGQADASFDPTDVIEFVGRANDGTLDTDLYSNPSLQPHPYYNLFSDTTSYFLTWNPLPVPGLRMSTFSEVNVGGLPAEPAHGGEEWMIMHDEYSGGLTQLSEIQSTAFDLGEGWTGKTICTGASGCFGQLDYTVSNLIQTAPSQGSPYLEMLIVGRNEFSHQFEVLVGPDGGALRTVATSGFAGFQTFPINVPLQWSDIAANGKMTIRIHMTGGFSNDRISVSYIHVTYPQQFVVSGAADRYFNLSSSSKTYVVFPGATASHRLFDVSDPQSPQLIGLTSVSGGMSAILPASSSVRKLLLTSSTRTSPLKKVSFRAFDVPSSEYIIISHRSLTQGAQQYASYRASAAGGGYDTLTAYVDDLYNQFNYGETSPRAIFKFMRYLTDKAQPKYLFLIGKGLEVSQGFYRKTSLTSSDFRDLVPTAGMPGSDMAFTAGLNGLSYEPAVPTGRLTASSPDQVTAYLTKVIASESSAPDLWKKNILHLSGGINSGEPALFRTYMDGFKSVAEGDYFGAQVNTISKQTLNVELINVKDQINAGLSLVTFFGHSGPGTIDIDIGYVTDATLGYNNTGKYPAFLINGCNAGRFFDNRITFGEDWMLATNKGAKAFIAHSFFGFSSTLKLYSDLFYQVAFGDSTFIYRGIGDVQQETAKRYLAVAGNDLTSITQIQQMVLLGDPALSVAGVNRADYSITNQDVAVVSLDGKPVTTSSAAYALQLRVENPGMSVPVPLKISVEVVRPDQSVVQLDSVFQPVRNSAILQFIIRNDGPPPPAGTYQFTVRLNPDQDVKERSQSNNVAVITYFIRGNGTRNLFPADNGIAASPSVTFVFQNENLQAGDRLFKIEVDTASTFDSPYLIRTTVNASVLARKNVSLLGTDSLVYYWRSRIENPSADESNAWTASSFSMITSASGWRQSTLHQLSDADFDNLSVDEFLKLIRFDEVVTSVEVKAYGSQNGTSFTQTSLKINGEEFNVSSQGQPCRNNTLNLIAFDRATTAPYAGIPFNFSDPRSCGREPQMINSYLSTELDAANGLGTYVANLSSGDSVVLFSIGDPNFASWSAVTFFNLSQLGVTSSQLSGLAAGEPFVIRGRKGASPGTATVYRPAGTPPAQQSVQVTQTVTGREGNGVILSSVIGPALSWKEITWQINQVGGSDQYDLAVLGIGLNGQVQELASYPPGTTPMTAIDAQLFPYIQLRLTLTDEVDLNPVQLRQWIVTYDPAPEGMLVVQKPLPTGSVMEGAPWKASFGFMNISNLEFADSLTVSSVVHSRTSGANSSQTFRIAAPAPGDTTFFDLNVATAGKGGLNDLLLEVNPEILPEVYHDNNKLNAAEAIRVEADRRAPVLDVTVDGRYLTQRETVSSAPEVRIRVFDDNPFLLKSDTTGIQVFVKSPCSLAECDFRRLTFSSGELQWTAASEDEPFTVVWKPAALDTGVYTLQITATDASGNESGDVPYEIEFRVTAERSVAFGAPHPNPSRDEFRIQVTISGTNVPDDLLLALYDAKGQLLWRLDASQVSELRIGVNTIRIPAVDSAGQPLPPGLYIWRMQVGWQGQVTSGSGRLLVIP